jgi:hypothetical protein
MRERRPQERRQVERRRERRRFISVPVANDRRKKSDRRRGFRRGKVRRFDDTFAGKKKSYSKKR